MSVGELERIKGRLLIIRAQLDLEIEEIDALIAREDPAGCAHRNRREVTAMGAAARTFICDDCGELVTEPLKEG